MNFDITDGVLHPGNTAILYRELGKSRDGASQVDISRGNNSYWVSGVLRHVHMSTSIRITKNTPEYEWLDSKLKNGAGEEEITAYLEELVVKLASPRELLISIKQGMEMNLYRGRCSQAEQMRHALMLP